MRVDSPGRGGARQRGGRASAGTGAACGLGPRRPTGGLGRRRGAARAPFDVLSSGMVILEPDTTSLASLHVVARRADQAELMTRLVTAWLSPPTGDALTIESPATLSQVQQQVAGDLGSYSHGLLLLVMGLEPPHHHRGPCRRPRPSPGPRPPTSARRLPHGDRRDRDHARAARRAVRGQCRDGASMALAARGDVMPR